MPLQNADIALNELAEAIVSGTLLTKGMPRSFMENERLIDPKSKAGKDFQAYFSGIAKRLRPDHDFNKHPVQFMVSDVDEANAYAIKTKEKAAPTKA